MRPMVMIEVSEPIDLSPTGAGRGRTDCLAVIQVAYDLTAERQAWLERLLQTLYPVLDRGRGAYAFQYTAQDSQAGFVRVESPLFLSCDPKLFQGLTDSSQAMPPEVLRALFEGPPCQSASRAWARAGFRKQHFLEHESSRRMIEAVGSPEQLSVVAWQGAASGFGFVAPAPQVQSFSPRTSGLLARAARHISAAARLREALTAGLGGAVGLEAEAVLSESGDVLHAEDAAKGAGPRAALGLAARRLLGSRERLQRRDPDEVVRLWNALVDGRWSLVHTVDRDGKRFLLAHRNCPRTPTPAALSPEERHLATLFARSHSLKLVSYELGLAPSTVSQRLNLALRKLGMQSRAELVRLAQLDAPERAASDE
jgi:DNA-binding CsgD family transcriptional regulator